MAIIYIDLTGLVAVEDLTRDEKDDSILPTSRCHRYRDFTRHRQKQDSGKPSQYQGPKDEQDLCCICLSAVEEHSPKTIHKLQRCRYTFHTSCWADYITYLDNCPSEETVLRDASSRLTVSIRCPICRNVERLIPRYKEGVDKWDELMDSAIELLGEMIMEE